MTAPHVALDPAVSGDIRLASILLDPSRMDSVALRRLVEEVRNDSPSAGAHGSYDRVHNRHNR